jgi:hypothetical protein
VGIAIAIFASAIFLKVIGNCSLKVCNIRPVPLWLFLPFFLAWQQIFHGIAWLNVSGMMGPSALTEWSKNLYLIFAFMAWPVFIPLSMMLAETHPVRKKILYFLLMAAVVIVCVEAWAVPPLKQPIAVVERSVNYLDEMPMIKIFFLVCISVPFMISNLPYMWVLGLTLFLAGIITQFVQGELFTLIWAFVAFILGFLFYFVTKENNSKPDNI